jgi:hypothetical protein
VTVCRSWLLSCADAAGNHGAHAWDESGQANHQCVHEHEQNERNGGEEMECARGFLAAEGGDEDGENGNHRGGHGQSGPDHQRQEKENHGEIGEALQDVVGESFFRGRALEAEVIGDSAREGRPGELSFGGKQVVEEVPRKDAGDEVQQAVQHAKPDGFEVHVTSLAGRAAEHEGQRQIEKGRRADSAGLAPVEAGVGEDDAEAADCKGDEGDGVDPMSDADEQKMPRLFPYRCFADRGPREVGSFRHFRLADFSTCVAETTNGTQTALDFPRCVEPGRLTRNSRTGQTEGRATSSSSRPRAGREDACTS